MNLTVKYNPADLGGRSKSTLRLARFDGGRTQWFSIPSTVDTIHHTVSGQNNEAGDYALIVDNAAPEPVAVPPLPRLPAPAPVQVETVPMSSGVTGKVYYDKNGDGVMDGDDFPIGGAGLKISSGSWSALTTTDVGGNYAFWSLRDSAYDVEVLVGSEWAFTTPSIVGAVRVTGQAGSVGNANFGMWYKLP